MNLDNNKLSEEESKYKYLKYKTKFLKKMFEKMKNGEPIPPDDYYKFYNKLSKYLPPQPPVQTAILLNSPEQAQEIINNIPKTVLPLSPFQPFPYQFTQPLTMPVPYVIPITNPAKPKAPHPGSGPISGPSYHDPGTAPSAPQQQQQSVLILSNIPPPFPFPTQYPPPPYSQALPTMPLLNFPFFQGQPLPVLGL